MAFTLDKLREICDEAFRTLPSAIDWNGLQIEWTNLNDELKEYEALRCLYSRLANFDKKFSNDFSKTGEAIWPAIEKAMKISSGVVSSKEVASEAGRIKAQIIWTALALNCNESYEEFSKIFVEYRQKVLEKFSSPT